MKITDAQNVWRTFLFFYLFQKPFDITRSFEEILSLNRHLIISIQHLNNLKHRKENEMCDE